MRNRFWIYAIKTGILFGVIFVMTLVLQGDNNRSRVMEEKMQASATIAVTEAVTVTPSVEPTIRPDYIPYPDELQTLPDFATLSPITDYVT